MASIFISMWATASRSNDSTSSVCLTADPPGFQLNWAKFRTETMKTRITFPNLSRISAELLVAMQSEPKLCVYIHCVRITNTHMYTYVHTHTHTTHTLHTHTQPHMYTYTHMYTYSRTSQ